MDHVEGASYAGETSYQFQQALGEYQLFKNGGEEEIKYPASLASKYFLKYDLDNYSLFIFSLHFLNIISEYQRKTKLHYVNIYFKSPTVDEITEDTKTNFVTKISVLGGTLGLFAGFSLLSGVELLYFLGTVIAHLGSYLLTKIKQ